MQTDGDCYFLIDSVVVRSSRLLLGSATNKLFPLDGTKMRPL